MTKYEFIRVMDTAEDEVRDKILDHVMAGGNYSDIDEHGNLIISNLKKGKMKFSLLHTSTVSWGGIFLAITSDEYKTRGLIGLSGDTGSGYVWLDILYFSFRFEI